MSVFSRNRIFGIAWIPIFVLSLASACSPVDRCAQAKAIVEEYLTDLEKLSSHIAIDEKLLKRLNELETPTKVNDSYRYYVYTSRHVASCSCGKQDHADVVVDYHTIAYTEFNPATPTVPPQFFQKEETRHAHISVHGGHLTRELKDPFCPPIEAIHDYEERLGSGLGSAQKNHKILDFLKAQQEIYLSHKNS